jgi:hypothetical protein
MQVAQMATSGGLTPPATGSCLSCYRPPTSEESFGVTD